MTGPAPLTPEAAHRKDPPGIGPWTVAMVLGLLVAILGVNAAIGAVQRKQYYQARETAVFFLSNGNQIDASTQRLQEVNARDNNLVGDANAALEAGDKSRFNRLMAQAGVFNIEQVWLQQKVQEYQAGFDKAANR